MTSSQLWLSGQPARWTMASPLSGWMTAVGVVNSQSALTRWRKVVAMVATWALFHARQA
ncbi:hypothetical protein D3C78_1515530 [compost metagenome]